MAWFLLAAAGITEIAMAAALKAADGWTRLGPSVVGIACALLSIFLLAIALKSLPSGTAYAVWTGIGAVGVAAFGIVAHGESVTPARLLCMGLVVTGVIGLRLIER